MIVPAYEPADGVDLCQPLLGAGSARHPRRPPGGSAHRDGVRPGSRRRQGHGRGAASIAAKGRPTRPPTDRACGRTTMAAWPGWRTTPRRVPALARQLMAAFLAGAAHAGVAAPRGRGQRCCRAGRTPLACAARRTLWPRRLLVCATPDRPHGRAGRGAWLRPVPTGLVGSAPRWPQHVHSRVWRNLGRRVARFWTAAPCAVGIESTIVDCTRGAPVVLRPGSVGRAQLEAACGQVVRGAESAAATSTADSSHRHPVHLAPWPRTTRHAPACN